MRFAVHWPAQRQALPRGHGMPCRDVPGRIHVRVKRETAGGTPEDGLALARLRVHVPARRAALARIRGIDLLDAAWGFLSSLRTRMPQPEARISRFSPAFCLRSCRAFRYVPLAERVMSRTRRSSRRITSNRRARSVDSFSAQSLRASASWAFSLAIADLSRARRLLPRPVRASLRWSRWSRHWRAADSRGQLSSAPVDSAALTETPRSTPTTCLVPGPAMGSGIAANAMCQRPTLSNFTRYDLASGTARDQRNRTHPAFGTRPPPVAVQPPDLVRPDGHDPEPLIPAGLAPGGLAVRACEEARHCLGEIAQCLLLDDHAARRQPPVLMPRRRKLAALLYPARRALPSRAPPRLLLHGKIPYEPGVRTMAPKAPRLHGRWQETIAGHGNMISKKLVFLAEGSVIAARVEGPGILGANLDLSSRRGCRGGRRRAQRPGRGGVPGPRRPRCSCCERRPVVGGAAVSEHPFGPDYTVTSLSYVVTLAARRRWSATCSLAGTATTSTRRGRTSRRARDGGYLPLPDDPARAARGDREVLRRATPTPTRRGRRGCAGSAQLVGPLLDQIPPKLGSKRPADLLAQAGLLRQLRGVDVRAGVRPDPAVHRQPRRPGRGHFESRRDARRAVRLRRDRHVGRAAQSPAPRT